MCIADEVQTGFGRTGTHFWGFELQGVVPDIVVLGKPIGNGHPIGAVITTPAIADAFNNGMEFFSTFGGNPVSCAIGLEVLDVVRDEGLQAHALQVGERMLAGLRPLVERYPIVGDVRGAGLFLGVELVRDRVTLEPAAEEASFVVNRLRDHGILLGTDGPYHNVVKIRPPMPFDEVQCRFFGGGSRENIERRFLEQNEVDNHVHPPHFIGQARRSSRSSHPTRIRCPSFRADRRLVHPHHRRDAILARDDGAVRHHPADFGDETACRHEQRRPGRVGAGADEDLAGGELRAARVEHHVDHAFHHARRDRAAGDEIARVRFRAKAFIKCAPIADQHARHLPTTNFALV